MGLSESKSRFVNPNEGRIAYDANGLVMAEGIAAIGSSEDDAVWTVQVYQYDASGLPVFWTIRKHWKWSEWEDIAP